jgi:hypothetical protein
MNRFKVAFKVMRRRKMPRAVGAWRRDGNLGTLLARTADPEPRQGLFASCTPIGRP